MAELNPIPRGLEPARKAAIVVAGLCVWAQGSALAQHVVTNASLSTTVTATHRSGSGGGASDEVVGQISPGVTASVRSGTLEGSLNYSANVLLYANEGQNNRVSHSLASSARYSLLSGRAGVDASASASEQVISAFGVQGGGDTASRDNRAQTFSYSISPFLTGQLAGQTSYQVRFGYTGTRAGSTALGTSVSMNGSAGLSGRFGRASWGLNASEQVSESEGQARNRTGRAFASLGYAPDVELQLTARYGRDFDNVRTGQSQMSATWGLGAQWVPGPRSSLSVDYDRRYFGDSYNVAFSHRMARTIWTYGTSRSVQTTPTVNRVDISAYELFYVQFASIEPDPVKREQLVRGFLAARGIDPNGRVVIGGFLTSLASVQTQQQLTAAYQGLRNTALVSFSSGSSRSIVQGATGSDDLASGQAVRQRGLTVSLSHQLGHASSLVLTGSLQRTAASGGRGGNEVRSLAGTWSAQLTPRASASIGARFTSFDSDVSPYNETAVFGTLGIRF